MSTIDDSQYINIYLCRHGESIHNTKRIICGQINSPLSPRGIEQAISLRDSIQKRQLIFDRCFSSPLDRAADTARYITGIANIEFVKDLIEIDAGDLSELTVSDIENNFPEIHSHGNYPYVKYPGGESLIDLEQRTVRWFKEEFSKAKIGHNYLIVGHWGTLNIILNFLLKIPIQQYSAFYINNCELTHVTMRDTHFNNPQIHKLNFI